MSRPIVIARCAARRLSSLALGTCALLATAAPGVSQMPRSAAGESDTTLVAAVVKHAAPRSFVVLAVPIPAELAGQPSVSYQVVTSAGVALLGKTSGQHSPGAGQLLLTLSVPADASAGSLDAAVVILGAPGAGMVKVPIRIDVEPVRDVQLRASTRVTGLYPGARTSLSLQVANGGNFTDTIALSIEAPAGWQVEQPRLMALLARGETGTLEFRMRVPERASQGDFFARLSASSQSGTELSSALVSLNVADQPPSLTSLGPTVRASLVAVAGDEESTGALQLAANGPLTERWSMDAQATALRGPQTPSVVRGLARVGTYVNTPTVRLWSERTSLTAGNVTADFGELAGVNAFGRGVAASHKALGGNVDVLAARPMSFGTTSQGLLLGARYGLVRGPVEVAGTATSLEAQPQRLRAYGLDFKGSALRLGTAGVGMAWREHGDGDPALGLSAFAQHNSDTRYLEVRAIHAPGGSRAFARAADELSGTASLALAQRWDAGVSAYFARDQNAASHVVESRSLSAFQQYRLQAATAARLELRSTSFGASAPDGSFGRKELALTAGVSSLLGAWFYSASASIADVTRTIDQDPIGLVSTHGPLFSAFGNGGWSSSTGTYQLDFRYEHAHPATGYRARQLSLGVSADRVRFDVKEHPFFLNGSLLYASLGSTIGQGNVVLQAGAATPLPNDITLSAGAERNPFFRNQDGNAGVVFALRLEKAAALPRLGRGTADGAVFRDFNGDGRRNADEPGMPNVRVRRGGVTVTTDATGAYRFGVGSSGEVMLDVTSLPVGWIAPIDLRGRDDVAVVPTSRVFVHLEVAAAPAISLRPVELSGVDVIARDRMGRDWLARRTESDLAVFDGLPAGEYTIVIDAARASEPLRTEADVTFVVRQGIPVELRVPLVGRPLRFGRSGGQ